MQSFRFTGRILNLLNASSSHFKYAARRLKARVCDLLGDLHVQMVHAKSFTLNSHTRTLGLDTKIFEVILLVDFRQLERLCTKMARST